MRFAQEVLQVFIGFVPLHVLVNIVYSGDEWGDGGYAF